MAKSNPNAKLAHVEAEFKTLSMDEIKNLYD
jgi:hypothetical protein